MEYEILKNCFAGRKGYTLHADPKSQKAQRLLAGGFIEPKEAPKPNKKPKAEDREKKVVKPKEKK